MPSTLASLPRDSKRRIHSVLGYVNEILEGRPVHWTISLRRKGERRSLIASTTAALDGIHQQLAPFDLVSGRDYLNAVRAILFEVTRTAVTDSELMHWVQRLECSDPAFGSRAKAALNSEAFLDIGSQPYRFPILYRNRRILIADVRSNLDCFTDAGGKQLVLVDQSMDMIAGAADWCRQGFYEGFVEYGPHAVEISGYTLAELAINCRLTNASLYGV